MRTWFSDASLEVGGGLGLEAGVYWRYRLTEEERGRMIRSRKIEDGNRLPINVLDMLGMMMTACVMVLIKKDRPAREGGRC